MNGVAGYVRSYTNIILSLDEQVRLLPSCTDAQKWGLLRACTAVLYTPEGEHFGIVPLEAMACCRPVIAVASGGPLETVVSGQTGFLCPPQPAAFAEAMASLAVSMTMCHFVTRPAVL